METNYIVVVMYPSGGKKETYKGTYLDGCEFSAAQSSYYNREHPVYLYQLTDDGQIYQGEDKVTMSFFNGSRIN